MRRKICLLAAGAALAALAVALTIPLRAIGQDKPTPSAPRAVGETRGDDEAAVRRATAAFIQALEKGDAKAVAAWWTENGEYIEGDGTAVRGRAALEKAYAEAFAKRKNPRVQFTVDAIRFPAKDVAIEEGHAVSHRGDPDEATTSRYSVLHVREGGRWLMAVLREWPDEGDTLRDLDWLIGTWESKSEEAEVRTTYAWDARKNAIHCRFSIKGKDRQVAGLQVILRDPRTGRLRSWLFDDDGGFGEGAWTRDGRRWLVAATGVEADGSELTSTNVLTPVDRDTFTWQSTERALDDEDLPNLPPVKVKRVR